MILARIQSLLSDYQQWLQGLRVHPRAYQWESLQQFQLHWDLSAPDPADMFERSFFNSENRRLWQDGPWQPKRMMGLFWQMDPATVRMMFDDLFHEGREIEGRIGRFLFGCDELLRDYKRQNIATVENNHDHGDYRMIALYLAFRYPESYAPYYFPVFRDSLIRFGARDIPQENDLGRYIKVSRTLMTFLDKEPGIAAAMQNLLQARRHYSGRTLLLVSDFCHFAAQAT